MVNNKLLYRAVVIVVKTFVKLIVLICANHHQQKYFVTVFITVSLILHKSSHSDRCQSPSGAKSGGHEDTCRCSFTGMRRAIFRRELKHMDTAFRSKRQLAMEDRSVKATSDEQIGSGSAFLPHVKTSAS